MEKKDEKKEVILRMSNSNPKIEDTNFLIGEIHANVKNIYVKLDALCKKIEEHDQRIDKLESFKDKFLAIASFLGLMLGYGIGTVFK